MPRRRPPSPADELSSDLNDLARSVLDAILPPTRTGGERITRRTAQTAEERQAVYQYEYARRKARGRAANVPTIVARGHGPIPNRIARQLEGERHGGKKLTTSQVREHRRGIAQYQQRYWGRMVTGRGRARMLPERFSSEDDARDWAEANGYGGAIDSSGEIVEIDGEYRIILI